ncbi:hypothetical protein amrb99_51370 [Actinomadura sp. RB99]|uniref:PIN-like domain-containing protein n=1 Tax=Actinomadura sp. RB99 TaxID=2691577 RepID=UPI001685E0AF|nr:hypothetical protein [Actinomadura sp. RB99]
MPPPASCWAGDPPEFYLDENAVTKAVRRRLVALGYQVHTLGELYGSWDEARGTKDERWLPKVGEHGWAVIGSDLRIFERPHELEAYRTAKVHVFLLPGQSTVAERVALIDTCLSDMCARAISKQPDVWKLTLGGVEPYEIPRRPRTGRRPKE